MGNVIIWHRSYILCAEGMPAVILVDPNAWYHTT